jgi:hypothetical protein
MAEPSTRLEAFLVRYVQSAPSRVRGRLTNRVASSRFKTNLGEQSVGAMLRGMGQH